MPWIAARNPFDGKPEPLQRTIPGDRLNGILGTGRMEATGRRQEWPYQPLITLDQHQQDTLHVCTARILPRVVANIASASRRSAVPGCLRSRTTTSRLAAFPVVLRNCSRINLLSLFRTTADGTTRLLMVIPSRECPAWFSTQWIANQSVICGLHCRIREKPPRRSRRKRRGNICRVWLHAKSRTTAGAAGGDHGTATLGLHADQKTMGAFSLGNRGLKCALHACS